MRAASYVERASVQLFQLETDREYKFIGAEKGEVKAQKCGLINRVLSTNICGPFN